MISITIDDIKNCTSKLFIEDVFHDFLFVKGYTKTGITTEFDGKLNKDFYENEEDDSFLANGYLSWQEVKPLYFQAIKGKRLPLSFQIVFALPKDNIEKIVNSHNLLFSANDIHGLFLNILYEQGTLSVTSGTSLGFFTLDKSLEELWDTMITNFFKKHQIN